MNERTRSMIVSVIGIIIAQVITTVIMAMFVGANHPLKFLYKVGNPLLFVVGAISLTIPFYLLAGYFFMMARNSKTELKNGLVAACIIFAVTLVVLWLICNFLVISKILPSAWEVYMIVNFPMGIVVGVIDTSVDAFNPILLLTALMPAILFYIGAIVRYHIMKKKGVITS